MPDLATSISLWEEDTQADRYLIYKIGEESYGIEISYVFEIINITQITKVPGLPGYLKGIINLRGSIVPVMDIRQRFGLPEREYNDRTCIIIAQVDGMDVGYIVDSVSEVATIPGNSIVPPPEINKSSNKFLRGIGKVDDSIHLLLDYQRLMKIVDDNANSYQ